MDIAAAEEEITRWKVAAEQEAAAGTGVEQEFVAQVPFQSWSDIISVISLIKSSSLDHSLLQSSYNIPMWKKQAEVI